MLKKLLPLISLVLLLGACNVFAGAVGVFEDTADIGLKHNQIGHTVQGPSELRGDTLVDTYVMSAGGADIEGSADEFHYAYKSMTGSFRVTANFDGWTAVDEAWAKYGVMLRLDVDPDSVNYFAMNRRNGDRLRLQIRGEKGGSTISVGEQRPSPPQMWNLGIQRVNLGGFTFVEALVDYGNGWELIAPATSRLVYGLPDTVMAGVAMTARKDTDAADKPAAELENSHLAQIRFSDVQYTLNPTPFVQAPVVAAEAAGPDPAKPAGFMIRSIKAQFTEGWNIDEANKLLDFGCTGPMCIAPGMPIPGIEEGIRHSQFVNLYDTGSRGLFNADNGYPDETFPGIDPFEMPAADTGGGDDDNQFATEVQAIIQLTAGYHMIGARHDDDIYIEIGGVEVGAVTTWDNNNTSDFLFEVAADGFYPLRVRSREGGGGAHLELHEIFADGTRILLGDVTNGGSPVFVPEPATIALLGLGGLALIGIRRKR